MKPAKKPDKDFDTFFAAYLECALWSSMDGSNESGGNPMDDNYSVDDITAETLAKMEIECRKFLKIANMLIDGNYKFAGHDFWLTRNGHGAGFWDGNWGKDGDELTTMAERFREVNLYIGDDNKIYQG